VTFEWDPKKERRNIEKHGVTFKEAKELFTSNVDFLEVYDGVHSELEERFIAIGPIRRGLVLVVYTERSEDTYASSVLAGLAKRNEPFTTNTWRRTHERTS
jgi:uncharacterized DUF497 family protein